MPDNRTNLEKYMVGEPLNEELAALKRGTLPDFGPFLVNGEQAPQNQSTEKPGEPISRADRVALKEWRLSPAYVVLQRLLENSTLMHQKQANLVSKQDPLANAQQIAQAWAYVMLLERVHRDIGLMVEAELLKLEEGETETA